MTTPSSVTVCRACGSEIRQRELKGGATWCRVNPPAGAAHVICEHSRWGWHEPAENGPSQPEENQ